MKLFISGCKVCHTYRADVPYTTGNYALCKLIRELPHKCSEDSGHEYMLQIVESPDLRYTLLVDRNPNIGSFDTEPSQYTMVYNASSGASTPRSKNVGRMGRMGKVGLEGYHGNLYCMH